MLATILGFPSGRASTPRSLARLGAAPGASPPRAHCGRAARVRVSVAAMDRPFIVDEPEKERFRLNRRVLVDPELLEVEHRRIFGRCWIYLGHDSEIPRGGDFRTRLVAGRPVLFVRDARGQGTRVPQHMPASRHHGVPRARRQPDAVHLPLSRLDLRSMAARSPTCRARSPTAPAFDKADFALGEVPALDDYRGFRFVHFGADPEPLGDYLAGRQGVSRPGGRPVAVRAARNRRRHPGIRHPRQLEAAGREQLRRLPPARDACDLSRLHEGFGRRRCACPGG